MENKTLECTADMHFSEIVSSLLAGKRIRCHNIKIRCDLVNAIHYRDLIELYLYACRISKWIWSDSDGGFSRKYSPASVLANLLCDLFRWPLLYAAQSREITRLSKVLFESSPKENFSRALFLRTDHWFNIKSGGSVGHIAGVINGLRSLGIQTEVVSTDRLLGVEDSEQLHLCRPIYRRGRNLPNFPEIIYNDQLFDFLESYWKNWEPDFIYQRLSLGNYTGVRLKRKYCIPFVCEYNGSFTWMARHWQKRRLFHDNLMNRIELLNLHASDIVVVVSNESKNELLLRGITPEKILVNPNGVDPERYSPNVDGSSIREKYALDGFTVLGFIGTFGHWHGAEVLAEGFGRLLQQYPEYRDKVRLLMIGDGPKMPLVKKAIRRHESEYFCILTGIVPQEQGPLHLAACDILVSPHVPNPDGTPFFGSPTKLFEYMAMGKGIVASDLDQIGEILEHEKTAWMTRPGDTESLVRGMKTLIDDEPLRNRLGARAREEAVAKYAWREHTRRIVEKLHAVCREA